MTTKKKPGRPIRGATATRQRAYRLDAGTIATIERLGKEMDLSHAQVVARAVEALAGARRPGLWELEFAERRGRLLALADALTAERVRQEAG